MRPILLAPHNDDETLFASFLILRHRPQVIVCYRSKLQEANGINAETRERETRDALYQLTGSEEYTQWQWPDDEDNEDGIEANMWGLLDPLSEDVPHVFAPAVDRRGNHQHNLVGRIAERVFGSKNVTHYCTYLNGAPRIDTRMRGRETPYEQEWILRKLCALACYRTQVVAGPYRFWLDSLREYVK